MQINKKYLSITALVALSALMAQGSNINLESNKELFIDYSAFVNFSHNLDDLRSLQGVPEISGDVELDKTQEIVGVIESELDSGNKRALLALGVKSKVKSLIAQSSKKLPKIEVLKSKIAALEINNSEIESKKFAEIEKHKSIKLENLVVELIKEKVVALSTHNAVDIQKYEINNADAIKTQAFSGGIGSIIKFSELSIEESYGKDIKDEVGVGQSATQKTNSESIHADEVKTIQHSTKKDESEEDDLQVFDYSSSEKAEYSPKGISETVKKAIQREMVVPAQKVPSKKQILKETLGEIDLNSPDNVVYDYSNDKSVESVDVNLDADISSLVSSKNTTLILKPIMVHLNTGRIAKSVNAEFISDYDREEVIGESAQGEISIDYSAAGTMNTHTGLVRAEGVIPTRIEINVNSEKQMNVPLLSESGILKFFQTQANQEGGNFMMFSIPSEVLDVEVDTKISQKFFLNRDLKIQNARAGADYVLISGVKSGNILISYLLDRGEKAQKVIYVGDGEMYFEHANINAGSRITVSLTSRNIMGQVQKGLSLDPEKLVFFATNIKAKKKALSAYELKLPSLAGGMRKYLELRNFKESVFVGFNEQRQLEIPTIEFMDLVLEKNNISELGERCLVQLNLSKDIKDIKIAGKNRTGEMDIQTMFLDKDGNFSSENPEYSEKAFILGDLEGLISAKVEYINGSSEYIKTFCSEGSYIIEQL